MHERADAGQAETRPGLKVLRGVDLFAHHLGLTGKADVVELRGGRPFPVEYKRGRPKRHRADEVQLCAQALCLEEMFHCDVPEGALFYGKTRRRKAVTFDADLRRLTLDTADQVRTCRDAGQLPHASYDPARCDACSLLEQCRPRVLARKRPVADWLRRAIETTGAPE